MKVRYTPKGVVYIPMLSCRPLFEKDGCNPLEEECISLSEWGREVIGRNGKFCLRELRGSKEGELLKNFFFVGVDGEGGFLLPRMMFLDKEEYEGKDGGMVIATANFLSILLEKWIDKIKGENNGR
jgi:hypothetical protein